MDFLSGFILRYASMLPRFGTEGPEGHKAERRTKARTRAFKHSTTVPGTFPSGHLPVLPIGRSADEYQEPLALGLVVVSGRAHADEGSSGRL